MTQTDMFKKLKPRAPLTSIAQGREDGRRGGTEEREGGEERQKDEGENQDIVSTAGCQMILMNTFLSISVCLTSLAFNTDHNKDTAAFFSDI